MKDQIKDIAYMVGTVIAFAGIGILLAWRV